MSGAKGAQPCAGHKSHDQRTAVRPGTGARACCWGNGSRTVDRTAVRPTVRTFCLRRTAVCPCDTTVRFPWAAQPTKNIKNKEKKDSKRTLPYCFYCFSKEGDTKLGLPPKKRLFKVSSLTLISKLKTMMTRGVYWMSYKIVK